MISPNFCIRSNHLILICWRCQFFIFIDLLKICLCNSCYQKWKTHNISRSKVQYYQLLHKAALRCIRFLLECALYFFKEFSLELVYVSAQSLEISYIKHLSAAWLWIDAYCKMKYWQTMAMANTIWKVIITRQWQTENTVNDSIKGHHNNNIWRCEADDFQGLVLIPGNDHIDSYRFQGTSLAINILVTYSSQHCDY